MARSVELRPRATVTGRYPAGIAAAAAAAIALSGCASTQTTAARERVNSARVRASQAATRVTHAGGAVHVQGVTLVTSGHRAHFVVTIHNPGAQPAVDLPISVGYSAAGHRVFLNAGTGASFFAAHLAAIGGHDTLSWVSDTTRALPKGARPFALVGAHASVKASQSGSLPVIATHTQATATTSLKVSVHNTSGVPQYQLPVYAVVRRHGRTVAAAQTIVSELSGGATRELHLQLLGAPGHASAVVQAPPTILQ